MLELVDRVSGFCGRLAAWMYFTIGGMIVYEVVTRYVFLSPTIWAEELSRFVQIWATYLAAAYVLRNRNLIVIDLFVSRLGRGLRRVADAAALAFVAMFCCVAIYYGTTIVIESVVVGRATSTMMAVPRWMTESAIPIGFSILLVQCIAQIARLFIRADGAEGEAR